MASTTTLSQVGPSIEVPPHTVAVVSAIYPWNAVKPTLVGIDSHSDVFSADAICVAGEVNNLCAATGIYANTTNEPKTLYGWGATASASSSGNLLRMAALLIKVPAWNP